MAKKPAKRPAAARKTTSKTTARKKKPAAKSTAAKKKPVAKKKPAARKTATRKAPARKTVAKKKTVTKKKPVARKTVAKKKPAARKTTTRKSPARKVATRKPAKRKPAARKTAARKTPARKTTARKPAAKRATRKPATKKPATRKAATRKTPARKTPARKTAVKRPAAKRKTTTTARRKTVSARKTTRKTTAKRPATKRTTAKRTPAKRTPAKRAAAKRPAAKKTTAKRTTTRKPAAKRPTPKRTVTKKTTAKKAPARKPVTKKAAPKKTAAKRKPAAKTAKTKGNSFGARQTLKVGKRTYAYYSLPEAEKNGLDGIARLPFSLKVLLENLLRFEDGRTVTADDIKAVKDWLKTRTSTREIAYRPARVLMQDFTGVPAVVDLAAMRAAVASLKGDPKSINPQVPVDLVIDHSVMVDKFGTPSAFAQNVELEYQRNKERYEFLRWGSQAFDNLRVVPPGTGICHQVNLENLAQTVWTRTEKQGAKTVEVAYPDTCVGTDSHTTMINGLAVLGWGVGGIEAEAAMLGQPISMLLPEVIGFKLTGEMADGVTATDMVLTITQMLRARGVVGKFVEFYGPGLDHLTLEDQATISNMAPEYGATCGFFPVDEDTLSYLKATGRDGDRIALVEAYAKAQGMFRTSDTPDPVFTDTLALDLSSVEPSLAGPKRPQDRVRLADMASSFAKSLAGEFDKADSADRRVPVEDTDFDLGHGDVVIAAITSCTNTSNPSVMLGAGLLARNAVKRGLKTKPWVKTSLAPGSQVVTDYLAKAGLQDDLNALGFDLVGYGCTTCIGNSGPLPPAISKAINENDLVASSVLSGNRNFEGRVSPDVKANYLASPPLVVAYAIAGSTKIDLTKDPLGTGSDGQPVYLKDIWPSRKEIAETIRQSVTPDMFRARYANVFKGDEHWQAVKLTKGLTYAWNESSTYVQHPPFFENLAPKPAALEDVHDARVLALFNDSITTDHISPAGSIKLQSPAGSYLSAKQVGQQDFNSYGSRRGNHQVMMRGTFANIRIKNQTAPGTEGGLTKLQPEGKLMPIYDAAMEYQERGVPLVVLAGKEYGTGSSRDWAAKGTKLLGVKAVIAQSFERIHRSNLIGMGVAPLQFEGGQSWQDLGMDGSELVTIEGLAGKPKPRSKVKATIRFADGHEEKLTLLSRIDTQDEVDYYANGGILQYVLRNLAA